MKAHDVYRKSDGTLTTRFYRELESRGPVGFIAMNLFRACKCSHRAKKYRGGTGGRSFRSLAYGRKEWSLRQLTEALVEHGAAHGFRFGWGRDENQPHNKWVLYVELPPSPDDREVQQVSFHSPERFAGPDYEGRWDGRNMSAERIIRFCQRVFDGEGVKAQAEIIVG